MTAALACTPPLRPLLQDQVCYGMYNQATVHQYRAEFALFKAAREGQPASAVADEAEAHLKARQPGLGWGCVVLLGLA